MKRTTVNLLVIVGLAVLVSILVAHEHQELLHNYPFYGMDSYELMARVNASVAAGHLVYLVPGDNGGQNIPLFWSHLLDTWIIGTAAPLAVFVGWSRALYFAGASVGPESLIVIGVAALFAARALGGGKRLALLPGIFILSSPSLISWAMFSRVNHRVLLAAVALWIGTLTIRSIRSDSEFRHAALAGAVSALGLWLSPEVVPFGLLAWAALLLGDAEQGGKVGGRGVWFAITFAISVILVVAVDPPYHGFFASVLDRVSIAYVELGVLMVAAAVIARQGPVITRPWVAAFAVAFPAILGVGIWMVLYPIVLGGVTGIMASPAASWFPSLMGEMWPVSTLPDIVLLVLVPTASLLTGGLILLSRRRDPVAVFAAVLTIALVAFSISHRRFTIYGQAAGAVVAAVLLESLLAQAKIHSLKIRQVVVGAIALLVVIGPIVGGALLENPKRHTSPDYCNARVAAAALNATAPHIILAPFSEAPAILYFSHATILTGPYASRTGPELVALFHAFLDRDFRGQHPPKSVRATGAGYILVCVHLQAARGSLYEALAHGQPPAWAIPQPIPPESGYKLFKIRY